VAWIATWRSDRVFPGAQVARACVPRAVRLASEYPLLRYVAVRRVVEWLVQLTRRVAIRSHVWAPPAVASDARLFR
jgi:hypothetical protein